MSGTVTPVCWFASLHQDRSRLMLSLLPCIAFARFGRVETVRTWWFVGLANSLPESIRGAVGLQLETVEWEKCAKDGTY